MLFSGKIVNDTDNTTQTLLFKHVITTDSFA